MLNGVSTHEMRDLHLDTAQATEFPNKFNDVEKIVKTEIKELHDALSKRFKIHIITKLFEILGGISLIIGILLNFGIGTNYFPNLGIKGIGITLLICLVILITNYVIFHIKKYRDIVEKIGKIKCVSEDTGCRFEVISDGKILVERNIQIVKEAKEGIYSTGSRSRDTVYLNAIESHLAENEMIIYYRVLYGNPHHQGLKTHLEKVLDIRAPKKRPQGIKTIFIGLYDNYTVEPEKFVCANESMALVVLPSFKKIGNYDAAIVFYDKDIAEKLCGYVRNLYTCSRVIEDKKSIKALNLVSS